MTCSSSVMLCKRPYIETQRSKNAVTSTVLSGLRAKSPVLTVSEGRTNRCVGIAVT
jgi:hypothetical protein